MRRLVVEFVIKTDESDEEVLERTLAALEVARYDVRDGGVVTDGRQEEEVIQLRRELEACRKAKEENDDRFQIRTRWWPS